MDPVVEAVRKGGTGALRAALAGVARRPLPPRLLVEAAKGSRPTASGSMVAASLRP